MAADRSANREQLLRFYRQMLRIRRFEAKCAELYQAQKIRGFLHLYDGEEAVAVGAFGAPFYIVDGTEKFWGQDRLEMLDLYLSGALS